MLVYYNLRIFFIYIIVFKKTRDCRADNLLCVIFK